MRYRHGHPFQAGVGRLFAAPRAPEASTLLGSGRRPEAAQAPGIREAWHWQSIFRSCCSCSLYTQDPLPQGTRDPGDLSAVTPQWLPQAEQLQACKEIRRQRRLDIQLLVSEFSKVLWEWSLGGFGASPGLGQSLCTAEPQVKVRKSFLLCPPPLDSMQQMQHHHREAKEERRAALRRVSVYPSEATLKE